MVIDNLRNYEKYVTLHPDFKAAFEFANAFIAEGRDNGMYELRGKSLYANVSHYSTKISGEHESHNRYIDIQILLSGEEEIHILDREGLEYSVPYDSVKDFALHKSLEDGTIVNLKPGDFCVIYPNEAHKPCIAPRGIVGENRKIVVKIACN